MGSSDDPPTISISAKPYSAASEPIRGAAGAGGFAEGCSESSLKSMSSSEARMAGLGAGVGLTAATGTVMAAERSDSRRS